MKMTFGKQNAIVIITKNILLSGRSAALVRK